MARTAARAPEYTTAELIEQRCKAKGLTNAELARRMEVTRSTVHDWVHGIHEPNLESLRKLAEVFECEVAELIGVAA